MFLGGLCSLGADGGGTPFPVLFSLALLSADCVLLVVSGLTVCGLAEVEGSLLAPPR